MFSADWLQLLEIKTIDRNTLKTRLELPRIQPWATLSAFLWECCQFPSRTNILIFPPILRCKYSFIILNNSLWHFRFRIYWGINYSFVKYNYLDLPFKERNKLKRYICIVFTHFHHTKLYLSQNLSLGFILKVFLKISQISASIFL